MSTLLLRSTSTTSNQPPTVIDFKSASIGLGTRLYWGQVTDSDDNLSDLVVYVYGDLFETSCAVDENGYFVFAMIIEDDVRGMEYAFAFDLSGACSDVYQDTTANT